MADDTDNNFSLNLLKKQKSRQDNNSHYPDGFVILKAEVYMIKPPLIRCIELLRIGENIFPSNI